MIRADRPAPSGAPGGAADRVADRATAHAPQLVPVTPATHARLWWRRPSDLTHTRGLRHVPLDLAEAEAAAPHLPILFHPDADRPLALLRPLASGPDALLDSAGQWRVAYVPAALRFYPFGLLASADQGGQAVLAVDATSTLITGDPRDERFYLPDGQMAPALAQVMTAARALAGAAQASRSATAALRAADLLVALPPHGALPSADVAGYQMVDPQRLAALDGPRLAILHRVGALGLAYLHRASLGVIDRLVALSRVPQGGIADARAAPAPDVADFLAALAAAHDTDR